MNNRPALLSVLRSLHEARRPRIIIGLRTQDPIPDWITHLALVSDGKVFTGTKEEILEVQELYKAKEDRTTSPVSTGSIKRVEDEGKPVVVLRNVNVTYGERKVRRRRSHLAIVASPRNVGTAIDQLDHPRRPALAPPRCKRYVPSPSSTPPLPPKHALSPRLGQNHAPIPHHGRPPPVLHPARHRPPRALRAPASAHPDPPPTRAHRRRLA